MYADVSLHTASVIHSVDNNGKITSIKSLSTNKNGVLSTSVVGQGNSTVPRSRGQVQNFQLSKTVSTGIKSLNQNILPPKSQAQHRISISSESKSDSQFKRKNSPFSQTTASSHLSSRVTSKPIINYTQSQAKKKNTDSSGKYVADEDKWAYKPDKSGKYKHVHVPYTGGYGPWDGKGINPYEHTDTPYAHEDHPFNNQFYNDKKPAIYREYGAPLFNNH